MRPLPTPPKVPPPTPLEYPRTPFLEVQRFSRGWIWVLALAIAVVPGTIIVRLLRRGVPLASRAS